MNFEDKKTRFCKVILKASNRENSIDQLKWVTSVLERFEIVFISKEGYFTSSAELPFVITLGLDTTLEQALLITWFFADITLDPENRADGKKYPVTGQTSQRNAAIEVRYFMDLTEGKQESRLEKQSA